LLNISAAKIEFIENELYYFFRLSAYFITNFIDSLKKYPRTNHVKVAGIEYHPTPAQPP